MTTLLGILRSPWQKIERLIDQTAMYRTVTIALLFLAVVAGVLGAFGVAPYTLTEQGVSLLAALASALISNWLCSKVWRVAVNMESAVITALILHFLIIPAQVRDLSDTWVIVAVTALAILSKFVFAWHKQHIANPAALGLVLMALIYYVFDLSGYFESSWWIGRPELFIPLVIAGAVVVTKVRKWTPVIVFLVAAFIVFLIEEYRFAGTIGSSSVQFFWLSGPSLFLAFFMLTEPFTMPPTKGLQRVYGIILGCISQTTLFLSFGIKMTPELALTVGNILFYPATVRRKLMLTLISQVEIAKDTFEFIFQKPAGLRFVAGQYMEWMLPHANPDNRGIRRYFTIASAPSADTIKLGVRFAPTISTYKQKLKQLQSGDTIIASQRAGDFTLPKDELVKIACVAGGIGITPFMSQFEEMSLTDSQRDSILFYCNNMSAEIAYKDMLITLANSIHLKVVHVLAKEQVAGYEFGYLTADIITRQAPDYLERTWYLSGPPGMVNAYKKLLRDLGVDQKKIICDFFPGLA